MARRRELRFRGASILVCGLVALTASSSCTSAPGAEDDSPVGGFGGEGAEPSGGRSSLPSGGGAPGTGASTADGGHASAGGAGGARVVGGSANSGGSGGQNPQTGGGSGGIPGVGGSGTGGTEVGGSSSGGANASGGGAGGPLGYSILMSSLFDGTDPKGEQARDVAFDGQGNFIMVGGTSAPDFPTTSGAYDTTHSGPDSSGIGSGGDYDAFVTKVGPDGEIIWSTFLGTGNYERAYAVEVGPSGDVYVAGRAGPGFPTTAGVYQPTFQGDNRVNDPYGQQDGFVARLSSDGGSLVWATYVGESGRGLIRDIDVDANGRVYVAMANVSGVISPAPEMWGPRTSPTGYDAFYGVLSSDGKKLLYGNYMGGSADTLSDGGNPCVRVGPGGDVFMLTFTDSADFSCVGSGVYDTTHNGGEDWVLARYTGGTTLAWCTFLGGSGTEAVETHSLAIDSNGDPVIASSTNSANIPTTAGALQTTLKGTMDAYAAIVSKDGSQLLGATYVGGGGADWAEGVAVAPNGDLVFSGGTDSSDFPVTQGALKSTNSARDGILVQLAANLTQMRYATYFGGAGQDDIRSLWVSPSGAIAFVGSTVSSDFPAVLGVTGTPKGTNSVVATLLQPNP